MKITTYNIQFTKGRDGIHDVNRIADAIRDSDIIGLQEVEVLWDRSGNISQIEELARRLPEHYYAWGPTVDILKTDEMSNGRVDNRRRQFGNMVLSRYPILSIRNHLYPKFGALRQHSIQRGVVEATIDTPLGFIRVYSTHLCHLSHTQRAIQIGRLLEIHRAAPFEGPVQSGCAPAPGWIERSLPLPPSDAIFLGDFNLDPTSEEYDLLVGPRSTIPNRIEQLRLSGYGNLIDAWVAAGNAEDTGPSFYSDFQSKTGLRIDYCFMTPSLAPRVERAEVDKDAIGSDHQPLQIYLRAE